MKQVVPQEGETVTVLLVDDHKMLRDGLKLMLASLAPRFVFRVSEVDSGELALRKISEVLPGLVILDYKMPGISGVETIRRMLRYQPAMKILVLSNYDELPGIQMVIEAGAMGYVLKSIEPAEMSKAIRTVLSGQTYYCSEVALKIIEASKESGESPLHDKPLLTSRETEVLRLIAMEYTNEEIARKLFVARRTIDTHRQNLLLKLGVKNTAGLVKAAIKRNLVTE